MVGLVTKRGEKKNSLLYTLLYNMDLDIFLYKQTDYKCKHFYKRPVINPSEPKGMLSIFAQGHRDEFISQ